MFYSGWRFGCLTVDLAPFMSGGKLSRKAEPHPNFKTVHRRLGAGVEGIWVLEQLVVSLPGDSREQISNLAHSIVLNSF